MPGYVGIRWLKVYALPTPERLERIVALAPCLDASYSSISTPPVTAGGLVEAYSGFLEGVRRLFMFDLASDLAELARATCNDGVKQYLQRHTPLVHLGLGDLYFYPPELLSTAYGNGVPGFLGFEFPAAFSPPPYDQTLVSDGLPNRRLFDAIRAEIMRGSKPVTVVGPTREWRLPLRVDPEMRGWLASHPVIAGNDLRLK